MAFYTAISQSKDLGNFRWRTGFHTCKSIQKSEANVGN